MVHIVTRAQWGARYAVTSGTVARSQRRYLVWHYPGGNVSSDGAAVCRSIEQQHKNQGWSAAPGYNLLISRGGTIYEGCGLDMRGIHSPPHNVDGIGVQMMLNVGEAVPPACASAGRALAHWINDRMGRQLTPWWHGRDYGTSCPGNPIINWVKAGYPAAGPPPGGAGTPAPPPRFTDRNEDMGAITTTAPVSIPVPGGATRFAVSADVGAQGGGTLTVRCAFHYRGKGAQWQVINVPLTDAKPLSDVYSLNDRDAVAMSVPAGKVAGYSFW